MKPLLLGYDAARRPIRLQPKDREIHMHIIGSSGSGKSRLLEWMMRGDLKNRQGFCLIDPHGELYDTVVSWCARSVLDRDIILLNLSEPSTVTGLIHSVGPETAIYRSRWTAASQPRCTPGALPIPIRHRRWPAPCA